MKTITITNSTARKDFSALNEVCLLGPEEMDASDGYHTFTELYDHRITLFIALCRALSQDHENEYSALPDYKIYRSKLHADGSSFEGWSILGIGTEKGRQITYHLPLTRWDETKFAETFERAPEWDGHTPADVLERLKTL